MGCAIPELLVLSATRKQAERASKQCLSMASDAVPALISLMMDRNVEV